MMRPRFSPRFGAARWLLPFSLLVASPAPTRAHFAPAEPEGPAARAPQVESVSVESILLRARASLVRVVGVRQTDAGRPASLSMASGLVYDDSGLVVTNATAITGCREVRVYTAEHRETPAEVVGADPFSGLGLLRVPAGFAPAMPRAEASLVREGTAVWTLGYSQGAEPVHGVGRITWRYDAPARGLFQMTNAVEPGNAGGAALDSEGRLLGLIVGELAAGEPAEGVPLDADSRGNSFAVPVDQLDVMVQDLKAHGRSARGYLGVRIEQGRVVDPARPDEPFEVGVAITEVLADGPAWRAGLRQGDLVVGVDGEPVNSPEELMQEVQRRQAGREMELVWVRNEERHAAKISLASPPDSLLFSIFESMRAATRARALQLAPGRPPSSR